MAIWKCSKCRETHDDSSGKAHQMWQLAEGEWYHEHPDHSIHVGVEDRSYTCPCCGVQYENETEDTEPRLCNLCMDFVCPGCFNEEWCERCQKGASNDLRHR